ncbi:MAG: hypothetical protein Q8K88_11780, partial [Bradyrhizobium sp.]|nr:hypothetical protein [Bradyrhizobium sp.]
MPNNLADCCLARQPNGVFAVISGTRVLETGTGLIHDPVRTRKGRSFKAVAACDIGPPRKHIATQQSSSNLIAIERGVVAAPRPAGNAIRAELELGATIFMTGFRMQSAGIVLMLAAMAPLLAGCDEPSSAIAAAQTSDPEVSIVSIRPQSRALVRELPGRVAPTRVS